MNRRFDPKRHHILDDVERYKWQDPSALIDWLDPKADDVIVEIGSGTGYFTIPLAHRFPKAQVYAVDVEAKMLDLLQKKLLKESISNVELVKSSDRIPVDSDCADLIIAVNVLHELEDEGLTLSELGRIIKPEGRLYIVDWIKKDMDKGPPKHIRLSMTEAVKILKKPGFRKNREGDLYPNHYTIEFKLDQD